MSSMVDFLTRSLWLRAVLAWLTIIVMTVGLAPITLAQADPNQGPGGPILVITSTSSPSLTFGKYYAEILRNEGLNEFHVADISTVTPTNLAAYDVVILAKMSLTVGQVNMFTDWVGNGGGNLIAMAPDLQLAGLLGIASSGTTLTNGYLLVDTSTSIGNGIAGQTMQFHGSANRYTLSGATSLATIYTTASSATSNPAVTLRSVGTNGGQAAAFAYDLATSIVYTRQGNPDWAAQERDGVTPIRSDDKFYGNASGDPQEDWIDLSKVTIPQADEQQRLLVNLILNMNLNRKPLPRFWYLPNGKKAAVIMTGDDHGNNGTEGRFNQFIGSSPTNCSVANWECVRGTSYIYPNTPLGPDKAAAFNSAGFEVGLHINTGCADFTHQSLENDYAQQIADWEAAFQSLPAPITQRHHCIAWSDWATGAKVELNHGMRLDTSYYYWPPTWIKNVPGHFTGSAMPMRFADLDGTLIDVYQAVTQMTDESGQSYPYTIDTLLDRALGSDEHYGVFTVNAHTDAVDSPVATAVVESAQTRGVPIVSSRQMLTWLDGRNNSTFSGLNWTGTSLSFTVSPGSGSNGLMAMLPLRSSAGVLSALSSGSSNVNFGLSIVNGMEYATFAALPGPYVATYAADTTAPTVTTTTPSAGATNVPVNTVVTVKFSEAMDPATINANTIVLTGPGGAGATVSYDAANFTATLTPSNLLATATPYFVTVKGGTSDSRVKDVSGNALGASAIWQFTTAASGQSSTTTIWDATATPANPADSDTGAVNLGVKFRSDVSGNITGIRFYKGTGNSGAHVGSLWSSTGTLLATANFANETAAGWQQVDFATPVQIAANTVYVASYFAPNGHYAGDNNYFASSGVDHGVLHALQDGVSGGNGVYAYSSSSTYPSSSWQSSNYWVDVVFASSVGPDTTPPTVTSTTPANNATNVAVTSPVTVKFSEAMAPATLTTSTLELTGPSGLVPATVGYDAATFTATLTPNAPLTLASSYTLTVASGTTGVKDVAGNALAANYTSSFMTALTDPCSTGNSIVKENCLPGNPATEWDVSGKGDTSIQGFATDISVNKGSTVNFKIKTSASAYRLDIYRIGYYGGRGARKVATVNGTGPTNASTACLTDSTGLMDCGNWAVSASWAVPATATSGIYFAKAVRNDTGGASHIFFIVRDDASHSDVLFQTSDTTWQAYNEYIGNSLYYGSGPGNGGAAFKVSYNRPFYTRDPAPVGETETWVFNAEYPMVRWLEANGYDVTYFTGVDTDRYGALIKNHKVWMSNGHDEYWSGGQRTNVEAARDAGVNLAFFSGNTTFWKTRWESSIDGSGTPYRTLVCYKETHANAPIDPLDPPTSTGTWRDPRFGAQGDGGRPENALVGTIFYFNGSYPDPIAVPAEDGKLRFWRNTSVASLGAGQTATLAPGTLGAELDLDVDNGFRPAGLFGVSTTPVSTSNQYLLDYGNTYGAGSGTHRVTLYKAPSGALVFATGTYQWSWGLDANHDRSSLGATTHPAMQQATVNLFADMGAQPATLQPGLIAATASIDAVAPSSTVASPAAGSNVTLGSQVIISGTAADTAGGVVAGVEVSVDGGTTWHPANGRGTWSYTWTPVALGSVTIKSRAVDDSGNLQTPGAGVTVTVVSGTQSGCTGSTLWPITAVPAVAAEPDAASVELGVKFRANANGFICGLRFYKGSGNSGTHVGKLWSSAGTLLASANFTTETATGWQQVDFASPVAITANTVYVASYLAPVGRYAADTGYFAASGLTNGPLYALRDGESGGNGVYLYGSGGFPSSTYQSTNYWVDVVFTSSAGSDTTPPTVTMTAPSNGATVSGTAVAVSANANDNVGVASVQFLLDGAALGAPDTAAPYAITWDSTTAVNGTHTLSARASDAAGNIATAGNSTVTVSNSTAGSPTAVNDVFLFRANVLRTASQAGPLGLGVLANDTDPANQPLTAVGVGTLPTGVTLASSGAVTINRSGATSFNYRASNGSQLSQPATGAVASLAVDSAPTVVPETCTYVRAGTGSVTGTACTMSGTRTFVMNLKANDTDPNVTTNVPVDGVGMTVTGANVRSTGTGVAVAANAACGQAAITKTASRASIVNNCDGTLTVTVTATAPASPITFGYRAIDDLGAQSTSNASDTVTVQ